MNRQSVDDLRAVANRDSSPSYAAKAGHSSLQQASRAAGSRSVVELNPAENAYPGQPAAPAEHAPNQGTPLKGAPSPMPKRHLPIEERKKVFNEWGAILRRQDEVEQAAQAESAH